MTTTTTITTAAEAKAAGYVRIGEWGDHLHGYRDGSLYAPAANADAVRAAYEADEIRDDSTLGDFYRETGCIWIAL